MYPPAAGYFKPQGIPMYQLDKITVSLDEYEALRLADYEELRHSEAAERMNISRPTFTRLLNSAHVKIANAIVNGKAIQIEGGSYILKNNRYRCKSCGNQWVMEIKHLAPGKCPSCESSEIIDLGSRFNTGESGPGFENQNGVKIK